MTTTTTTTTVGELLELEKLKFYTISAKEGACIYKEIFDDGAYDIELPEAPTIVDAGANIGLFTLYMKHRYPSAKILAFEPAPDTYQVLQRNLDMHGLADVETFELGLSSQDGQAELTYFPNLPGNSSMRPEEKELLYQEAIAKNGQAIAEGYFGKSEKISIKLERLSTILNHQKQLSSIDLLKVDVEGAELEVLRGLTHAHWDIVRNLLVETWEKSGDREEIEDLLKSKGFEVKSSVPEGTSAGFYMVRAYRKG